VKRRRQLGLLLVVFTLLMASGWVLSWRKPLQLMMLLSAGWLAAIVSLSVWIATSWQSAQSVVGRLIWCDLCLWPLAPFVLCLLAYGTSHL